jgi:hypothetical protein
MKIRKYWSAKDVDFNSDEFARMSLYNAVYDMFDELIYIKILNKFPEDATVADLRCMRKYGLIESTPKIKPKVARWVESSFFRRILVASSNSGA